MCNTGDRAKKTGQRGKKATIGGGQIKHEKILVKIPANENSEDQRPCGLTADRGESDSVGDKLTTGCLSGSSKRVTKEGKGARVGGRVSEAKTWN